MTKARGALPEPLVPSECDIDDFRFMPLEIERLRKSKAWLKCRRRPELAYYMLNLWMRAYHEKPAGSIENDDDVLADAAACSPVDFPAIRGDLLRGWIACSDGRLYHPVVCEKVLEGWVHRLRARYASRCETRRKAAYRAAQNKQPPPGAVEPFATWLTENYPKTASISSQLFNIEELNVSAEKPDVSHGTSTDVPRPSRGCPPENAPKLELEGQLQLSKEEKVQNQLPPLIPPKPEVPPPEEPHAKKARRPAQGGTRWTSDAAVSEDWIREGEMRRVEHGLPPIDLRLEAERFVNYWASKSGQSATKVDWHLTWINWSLSGKSQHKNGGLSAHDKGTLGAALYLAEIDARDRARASNGIGTSGNLVSQSGYGPEKVVDAVPDLLRGHEAQNAVGSSGGLRTLPDKQRK